MDSLRELAEMLHVQVYNELGGKTTRTIDLKKDRKGVWRMKGGKRETTARRRPRSK